MSCVHNFLPEKATESSHERKKRILHQRRIEAQIYKSLGSFSERLNLREAKKRSEFSAIYPALGSLIEEFVCPNCGWDCSSEELNACCRRYIHSSLRDGTLVPSHSMAGVVSDLVNWVSDTKVFLSGSKLMDVPRVRREVAHRVKKSLPYWLARELVDRSTQLSVALRGLDGLVCPDFVATGGDDEVVSSGWYERLFATVKARSGSLGESMAGAISTILDSIFSFAGTVLGAVASILGVIMEKVKFFLGRVLQSIFLPGLTLKQLGGDFWDRAIKVVIALVLLALGCFGLVSFGLGFTVSSLIVRSVYRASEERFVATSGVEVFSVAMGLSTLLAGGFSPNIEKTLLSKMKTLTALAAGGLIVGKSGMHLFYLLPTILQHGLVRKFGTKRQVNELDLEDWMPQAMGLIKVSNIPEVLSSEFYFNLVKDVVDKGSEIVKHVPPERRTAFSIAHFHLLRILSTLTRFQTEGSERTVPFCFHICGAPGVGKSVILPHLLKEVFGFESKDMYYRPVESEFWNAYSGQPAVIYDEFLIGGTADPNNMGLAKEFLSCVSSSKFQPPLASVDQPTVGIKGTSARPRVVVTMNNNPYDSVPGINNDALQRRRQFVLEIKVGAGAPRMPGNPNNVDLSGYAPEEIKSFPWMRFRVINAQFYSEYSNLHTGRWYDYENLVSMIKEQVEVHERTQRNLMTAMSREVEPINVRELVERELRNNYCMPNMEESKTPWIEFFSSLLAGGKFGATSGGKRKSSKSRVFRTTSPTAASLNFSQVFGVLKLKDGVVVTENQHGKWVIPGGQKTIGVPYQKDAVDKLLALTGILSDPLRVLHVRTKNSAHTALVACSALVTNLSDVCDCFSGRTSVENSIRVGLAHLSPVNGKICVSTKENVIENPTFGKGVYNDLMAVIHNDNVCGDFFCDKVNRGYCPGHENAGEANMVDSSVSESPVSSGDSSGGEYLDAEEERLEALESEYKLMPAWLCGKEFNNRGTNDSVDVQSLQKKQRCENFELGCCNEVNGSALNNSSAYCNACILNGAFSMNKLFLADASTCVPTSEEDMAQGSDETDGSYYNRLKDNLQKLGEKFVGKFDLVFMHVAQKNGDGESSRRSLGSYLWEIWNNSKVQFIRGMCIGYLFTLLILIFSQIVRSMALGVRAEEPSDLFHATSEGPGKSSRGKGSQKGQSSRRGFKKATEVSWKGTSSDIEMVGLIPESGGSTIEYATPVKGKWIVLHAHVREKLFNRGRSLKVSYKGKEYIEKVDKGALFIDEDNDFMLYEIQSRSFPSFPDNFSKFVSESEIADVKSLNVRVKARGSSHYASGVIVKGMKYDCEGDIIVLERCFMSSFHSLDGDCGNYVLITGGPLAGKILGIVVAGSTDGTSRSLSTIVTKDMLREVLDPTDICVELEEGSFAATGCPIEGPNIVRVEMVPKNQRVHLPQTTVLRPSLIASFLEFESEKQPAVLSVEDPRSNGKDPVVVGLNNLGSNAQSPIDSERLLQVAADMLEIYQDHLYDWPDRVLTVREAIGGVPGLLASLKTDTSPGIPHVAYRSKKGKKDFFSFEKGEIYIEPGFEELVVARVEEFMRGEIPEHIWAGYLKDELVSPGKVQECRTRIIYCGEVVSLVALRCLFGSTILRINNSRNTPSAIGINQYSNDMDQIFNYLTETGADKFIAGDYKKFDQCMQEPFLKEAYRVLGKLTPHVDSTVIDAVYQHQVKSPLQMGPYRIYTICDQKSGSLFTSIVNNFVNELYMRYCFDVIEPEQYYDEVVRGKFLGDDHVLGVVGQTKFDGLSIRRAMADLGQTYTSSIKTKELTPYENFEEITFLGAHPRFVNGRWTGALRKETLYQAPMWTKDHNLSLPQVCQSMVELASQWAYEFYHEYKTRLLFALRLATGVSLEFIPYGQLQREVASRTSGSGKDYFFRSTSFKATGSKGGSQELVTYMGASSPPVELVGPPEHNEGRLAVSPSMTIADGTNTTLFRTAFTWDTTQIVGTTLFNLSLPFGLLAVGEQDNIQNMPFNRFIYWRGDVEVMVQLSGNQFQQGALILYFVPLCLATDAVRPKMEEIATTLPHVFMHPGNSSSAVLRIPYRFFRTRLNTFAKEEPNETLGYMVLKVFSKLRDPAELGCTIAVFSKFPDSVFSVPRPLSTASFVATGNSLTSNYWIGSMVGKNSFEGARQTGMTTSLSASASASQRTRATGAAAGGLALEMDKPVVGGGAIPVAQKFPSLANTEGMDLTNVLSTCPNDLSQQHYMNVDPAETNIEKLCNRPMLGYRLNVTTTTLPGTVLVEFPLDSIMFQINNMGTTTTLPFCLQVLNLFCFWRADFVLTFVAFKTAFHSFRLKVVVGFGAPSIGTADNTYFTGVLDFSGDNREHKVVIPYNQVLEYLATYSGQGVVDPLQNGSLGHCSIKLMNKLVAPTNVTPDVEIGLFVALQNVKVAHPRPYPFLSPSSLESDRWYYAAPGAVPAGSEIRNDIQQTNRATNFKATGNVDDSGQEGDGPIQDGKVVSLAGTPTPETVRSCEHRPSEKFMHPIGDLVELLRRPVRLQEGDKGGAHGLRLTRMIGVSDVDAWQLEPGLWGFPSYWYRGWAGSITVRIFSETPTAFRCIWIPNTTKCGAVNSLSTSGEINLISLSRIAQVNALSVPATQYTVKSNAGGQHTTFCGAHEESYPVGERNWTTITLPYTTNLDFTSSNYRWTPMPGTLLVVRNKTTADASFYVSAADDLRCIGLVPSPYTVYGLNSAGSPFNIGNNQSFGGWIDKV